MVQNRKTRVFNIFRGKVRCVRVCVSLPTVPANTHQTCGPSILLQELAVVSLCVLCGSAVLVDGLCSDIMIL